MRSTPLTGWRRIASAMWRAPDDPQIFGALDVDAHALLAYIDDARAAGHRITPTHLVGRALAHALQRVPELNVKIRRGKAFARDTIDVFFIASVAAGRDLSGVKISDVAHKSVVDVAVELTRKRDALVSGRDRDFARTKRASDRMPAWLLRPMLRATSFITEDLGLDVPWLGLRHAPFGSAMVTNVATFGLPQGFAPLAWMYDVPLLILVGEIVERPVVDNGRVIARKVLPVTATIDHRYVDGSHLGEAMRAFREYLADPARLEGVARPLLEVLS